MHTMHTMHTMYRYTARVNNKNELSRAGVFRPKEYNKKVVERISCMTAKHNPDWWVNDTSTYTNRQTETEGRKTENTYTHLVEITNVAAGHT